MSGPTPAPTLLDRMMKSIRAIVREEFPRLTFFGMYEFAVQSTGPNAADLQPTDSTIGLPDMVQVPLRLPLISTTLSRGALAIVAFVNGDPTRPFVLTASSATEHIMTSEATALLLYNTLVALFNLTGPGPLTVSPAFQAMFATAIGTALTAQIVPAPPGTVAQIATNTTAQAGFATGTVPVNTMFAAWSTAIAGLATKTPDVTGLFPSVGCNTP